MGRKDVRFRSGEADCAGWLYRPTAVDGELPCVVLAHGFGGVKEARLDAYAERFAAAGYAALVFDYRRFGESGGEPRQLLEVAAQQADWRAAIAYARGLDGVDSERIALWGTSFSGGHVVEVAGGDPRIAAAIAQAPFMDGIATLRAVGPLGNLRLGAAALRDAAAARLGRRGRPIALVGPPGSLAAMTSPDAEPGYLRLLPPGFTWLNSFLPRRLLEMPRFRPWRHAGRVRAPLLVQAMDGDVITPPGPARRAAARAPRGELISYSGGHFEIYLGEPFERAVADQLAFLGRHLAA